MKRVKQQITLIVSEMLSDRPNVLSADVRACVRFQEFLRCIPGSLLCCELHQEWVDVLEDEDDEEEQVQDIKRCKKNETSRHVCRSFLSCVVLTASPVPQNDRPSAQREHPAAALRAGSAAHDPRQRPGERDDQFQFVSVHLAQPALASRAAIESRVGEGETGKGETTAAWMNFTSVAVESDF